jgi:hypothetical protein
LKHALVVICPDADVFDVSGEKNFLHDLVGRQTGRIDMATTIYPTVPVAQPEAELWPVDNDPVSIEADEMFPRQLDTGFAGEIRNLLHDRETGLVARDPEKALIGIAEAAPKLDELKERFLAQAIRPLKSQTSRRTRCVKRS